MAKKYKCRVEYLESTGGQWIDIGVGVKSNTIAKAIFSIASTATGRSYFGARNSSNERFQIVNSFGVGNGYFYNANIYPIANQKYEIEMHANGDVYLDGVKRNATNGTFSPVAFDRSLYIFSTNYYDESGVPSASTFWKVQILEGDTLVRDMIPVLDLSGRPAMYDQVSGKLFYNQGTGEFTYGRQIIPVEYLESTGTQYIDTGIKFDCANTKIELKTYEDSLTRIHSICGDDGNIFYYFRGTGNWAVGYNATASNIDSSMVAGDNVFVIDKNNVYLNGVLAKTYTASSTVSSYNALLFNRKTSLVDKGAVTMYYCKIWDNNTLVRDFIPCMDENHIPFMFDLVSNTCYLNAGTGQFKVGPNVEKVWGGKKLRRKLGLALANLKKPRKYYCEVEYLEGTGTQYIDTGLDYFADFEVGIQLRTSVSNKALGNGAFYCMQRYNQANPYWYFSTGTGTSNSYITSTPITEHHIMKWKNNKIYSDGVLLTDFTKDSNAPNRMYLYSADGTNKYPNVIYFCKLWNPDNGELVRDFIPVLDWNMKPCLFDKVTEQLFYNQATSGNDFSYGREIHYVEYLESTGTQYIDTGVKLTNNHSVELDYQLTNASQSRTGLFGALNMTGSNQGRLGSILSPSNRYLEHGYGSGNDYWQQGLPDTDRHLLYQKKNEVYFDGTLIHTFDTATFSLTMNAYLGNFVYTNYTPALAKYYGSRWWDGDTLIRDYAPAIDENGVGFMLDRVSHTCFLNAGTGAFGYSAREVEYLESDGARAIVAGVTIDDTCGYDVKWMALNANDTIIMGTKGSGDSRWVLSGNNNPNVNLSWNKSYGSAGLGLNKIQTAQMNYMNDRKRILNDTPLVDITETLSSAASTYNVGIFGGYWGASSISLYSTCRIYYAKITKGTELIRDFIPMVKDGSPCLFDKIGGLYYFGTGTGTFTTGKIVEPEYE